MTAERHRPTHHLTPTRGWLNDPNAPIQYDGVYHIFAQFNPAEPVHGNIHWAHWTSDDLLYWTEQPIALTPVPGGADEDGCWSGSAIAVDGDLVLVYSGYRAGDQYQSVCVARPGPDGRWTADSEPVLVAPPPEVGAAMMRDPFCWRVGDEVRMMLGSGDESGNPMALVFSSTDLTEWTYIGVVSDGRQPAYAGMSTGAGWECPHLLRRGGRGVLIMSAWSPPSQLDGVFWSAGPLVGDRLDPAAVGRVDYGPDFYAADLFVDDAGDAIVWAWAWEACDPTLVEQRGWAGMLTAPRVVTIDDEGRPFFAPATQLAQLREHVHHHLEVGVEPGQPVQLEVVSGTCLDIEARLVVAEGGVAWLRVLASSDGSEFTEIGVDPAAGELYLDRSSSSSHTGAKGGRYSMPVTADADRGVDVRVLVDASIVEVFAQGKSLTARVYPESPDSVGLTVGAEQVRGRVVVDCWPLA